MEYLGTRNFKALSEAVREIYSDLNPASLPDTIVKCASKIIPCSSSGLEKIYRKNPKVVPEALSWTAQFERWDVFNEYIHEHPYLALLNPEKIKRHPFRQDIEKFVRKLGHHKQPHKPAALKISDLLSNRQFHSLALFNEFYRCNQIGYQMGTPLFSQKGSVITLCFNRDTLDFTEKDRTLLNMLAPHIIQAQNNAEVVGNIRADKTGVGKMLLDGRAKDLGPESMKAMGLTIREGEILHWISQGKTNAEISVIFNISLNTVKTHQRHIYEKLGVENRVAAARFVLENG